MIEFDPRHVISNVILVGTGGTGSAIAKSLGRMLYDMKQRRISIPKVIFVDPDRVETKNVNRQGFCMYDAVTMQFKAVVLAQRLNLAYGLEIHAFAEEFNPKKHMPNHGYTLIVGSVDNYKARRTIARCFTVNRPRWGKNIIWLSCGNHDKSGQITLGNTANVDKVANSLTHAHQNGNQVQHLPYAGLVFPTLLQEPSKPEKPEGLEVAAGDCAADLEAGHQHILINSLMADVASSYIYNLLHRKPVNTWLTYINLDPIAVASKPINAASLEAYIGSLEMPAA